MNDLPVWADPAMARMTCPCPWCHHPTKELSWWGGILLLIACVNVRCEFDSVLLYCRR